MIRKLSTHVWWGDAEILRRQHERGPVAAVLNVAHNLPPGYRITHTDPEVRYFRLARADEKPVDADYWALLLGVLELIDQHGLYPLAVHCRAGHHRSPMAAVAAEWNRHGRPAAYLSELHERAAELLAGKMSVGDYHRSLYQFCEANCA